MKKASNKKLSKREKSAKKTEAARAAHAEANKIRSDQAKKDMLYAFEVGITKISDACNYAGVSFDWYNDHVKAEPAFVEAIEQAKTKRKMRALGRIVKAGETSWQAEAWFLERVHSEDYALKQRLVGDPKDLSPIIFEMRPAPLAAHQLPASDKPADSTTQGTKPNAQSSDRPD